MTHIPFRQGPKMTLLMTSAMIDDAMILWRSAARRHERCLASGATRSVHRADDPEDRMGINSLKIVYIYVYIYIQGIIIYLLVHPTCQLVNKTWKWGCTTLLPSKMGSSTNILGASNKSLDDVYTYKSYKSHIIYI